MEEDLVMTCKEFVEEYKGRLVKIAGKWAEDINGCRWWDDSFKGKIGRVCELGRYAITNEDCVIVRVKGMEYAYYDEMSNSYGLEAERLTLLPPNEIASLEE
jgi:hypothetical protein